MALGNFGGKKKSNAMYPQTGEKRNVKGVMNNKHT